jgi:hypothetical protein
MTADAYSKPWASWRKRTPQIMSKIVVGIISKPAIIPHRIDWRFRIRCLKLRGWALQPATLDGLLLPRQKSKKKHTDQPEQTDKREQPEATHRTEANPA